MTDQHPGMLPEKVDTSRHYAETRRTNLATGESYHMNPYCPRCSVAWPCPSAATDEPGGAT